jgi:hypothetical protein
VTAERPRVAVTALVTVVIAGAVLATVAAVSGVRALRLAGGADPLTAHNERRWRGFAYRDPEIGARLGAVEAELVPGETVHLVVPPESWDPNWLRVMARYYLPAQRVAGVSVGAPPEDLAPEVTVVEMAPDAVPRVSRPPPVPAR